MKLACKDILFYKGACCEKAFERSAPFSRNRSLGVNFFDKTTFFLALASLFAKAFPERMNQVPT